MSDRELDAWLAEHLLGWSRGLYSVRAKGDTTTVGWMRPGGTGGWDFRDPPKLSSTGDGMLLVMEALKARGLVAIVKADGLRDGNFSPAYTALVGNMPRVDDKTGPLALARAAKLAIEAEAAPVRERGAQ